MAQSYVNLGGQPNDGTGDSIRDAFDKVNNNFTDLYSGLDIVQEFVNSATYVESQVASIQTFSTTIANFSATQVLFQGDLNSFSNTLAASQSTISALATSSTTAFNNIGTLSSNITTTYNSLTNLIRASTASTVVQMTSLISSSTATTVAQMTNLISASTATTVAQMTNLISASTATTVAQMTSLISSSTATTVAQMTSLISSSTATTVAQMTQLITDSRYLTWSISASDSTNYTFSGPGIESDNTIDPVLYLYRGYTYKFINTTGGSHPFAIRVSNGGNAYTSGVSGSQTGTQTFTVPMNAPSTLYYQCTIHSSMGNTINIV